MPPIRRPSIPVAVVAVLAAAGCTDAPTEPAALVVAAETEAALRVAAALPTLPEVLDRARVRGTLSPDDAEAAAAAHALWTAADSAQNPIAARALRRRAYETAAPVVARALGPAGLSEVESGLRRWVEMAESASEGMSLPGVGAALMAGRTLLARAVAADHADQAAALLLEAADRLRETTPDAVAARLILQVESALAREDRRTGGGPGPVARRRAERLLRGANRALSDGDPVLAIRRAYYARQLLGLQ